MVDPLVPRHFEEEKVRSFVEELASEGRQSESAGEALAIHLPPQNSHANQPKQIVFERFAVAIPVTLPAALIGAGVVEELDRIQSLMLQVSVESFRKRQAAHGSTGPVAAALVEQFGGVSDGNAA